MEADDRISKCVARFLKKAWRSRKRLTAKLSAELGRSDTAWALNAHGWGSRLCGREDYCCLRVHTLYFGSS